MNNPKVSIVTSSVSKLAGGMFFSVRSLAHELKCLGVQVHVHADEDHETANDLHHWHPLDVTTRKHRGIVSLVAPTGIFPSLKAFSPDIIHLHGLWSPVSIQIRRYIVHRRIGLIVSPRGMLDRWAVERSVLKKSVALKLYEQNNLRGALCLHALNESEAEAFRSFGLRNPIAVIPNGTALENTDDVVSERMRPGKKRLVFLGRIHPKKGLSILIEALRIVASKYPTFFATWEVLIAGWDEVGHQKDLEKLVLKYGLVGSVSFVGPMFDEQKERLLRSAHAFVLPSFSEGMPMAVLEAWSFALPVFMTRECNLPIGFTKGAAVLIDHDPERLAAVLFNKTQSTELFEVGLAGRALVEEHFSWSAISEKMASLYGWVLSGGEAPEFVIPGSGQ